MRYACLTLALMLGASAAPARDPRLAVVDLPRLFAEYPGTRAAQKRYEAVALERERQLLDESKVLRERQADFDRRKAGMSVAARKAAEADLKNRARELESRRQATLAELKDREDRVSREILDEIRAIVAREAAKRKLDLVLDREKAVYVKDALDLTPILLESFRRGTGEEKP